MGAPHTLTATAPSDRGWSDFVQSPIGQLAAFVALAAVALVAVAEPPTGTPGISLGLVALTFIALGCTAVLAYRDA